MRPFSVVVASAALVLLACSSTPDIPNDLRGANAPAYPKKTQRGTAGSEGSGADPAGDPGDPAGPDPDPGQDPAPAPAPSPTPAPDAGADSTLAVCLDKTSQQTCYACCEAAVPGAIDKLDKDFADCLCSAARCGNECGATACAGQPYYVGDPCDVCLTANEDACGQAAVTACENDRECRKLFACDEASQCASKPAS